MKNSKWTIIDSGASDAQGNMEIDAKLLQELDPSSISPVLHFYDWISPSATYGHFINPSDHLSEFVFTHGYLQLAKRPTGGGLIFHTNDLAFSVLVPAAHDAYSVNILENYAFVNRLVIEVIEEFVGRPVPLNLLLNEPGAKDHHSGNFCMAKPTKYDVMLDGRKVGGGAQRRTRAGFLHQGTISLSVPDRDFLGKILLPHTCVHKAMLENTCSLLSGIPSPKELCEARQSLRAAFKKIILSKT